MRFYGAKFTVMINPAMIFFNRLIVRHMSRVKQIAIKVFKITHNLSLSYLHKYFSCQNYDHATKGNSTNMRIDHHSTVRHGTQSFRHIGAKIWNALPKETKGATTLS